MKYNKIQTVLASSGLACAMLLSTSASAVSTNYDFTFDTVQDVALVPVTELNFGGKLGLQAGDTCEMRVGALAANAPGVTAALMADGTTLGAGANYGELFGADCGADAVGTDGTPGVYRITGAGGVVVDISLTSQGAGAFFNFVPAGVAVNYDGAADGDDLQPVNGGLDATITLANTADQAGNTPGSGFPVVGESLIFLGGDITVTSLLNAGQEYTQTFGIDVVYQ